MDMTEDLTEGIATAIALALALVLTLLVRGLRDFTKRVMDEMFATEQTVEKVARSSEEALVSRMDAIALTIETMALTQANAGVMVVTRLRDLEERMKRLEDKHGSEEADDDT